MIIPKLEGSFNQNGFFIYTACDQHYFTEFGVSIINSIKRNSNAGIHIHLYNPLDSQINYCQGIEKVSITYEYIPLDLFSHAARQWSQIPTNDIEKSYYDRTLNAMSKSNDTTILERMQKTYYACARFIRLDEISSNNSQALAIDSDAVVRNNIPLLPATHDLYIHRITGKKARFLAGGIYLTGNENSKKFINDYATTLKEYINKDYLYWGIDQDILEKIVPKYNYSNLPLQYIDWEMKPTSCIWTAKGKRKELKIFTDEQKKYIF